MTTSNYNADQGEGSGAQVSLVTKSGTNNFHGSLYEYHRKNITSANKDTGLEEKRVNSRPAKVRRSIEP